MTTQYLDEADQLADRVVVLDGGRKVAEGTPAALKSDLGGDRISVQVRETADLAAVATIVARVTGVEPELDGALQRVSAPVRDRVAALTALVRELDGAMLVVDDISVRRPTLDEVFLHLTGPQPTKAPVDPRGGAGMSVLACPAPGSELRWLAVDSWTIARRDLVHWVRNPAVIISSVAFPVMFVLLFGYVFGSAITVPGGGDYREFLMPGMFAQAMVNGAAATVAVVAADQARGVTDRFRSMPMSRGAALIGRSIADLANSVLDLAVLVGCGLLVGWVTRTGPLETLAAIGLLLLLRFAMIWVGIFLGLVVTPGGGRARLGAAVPADDGGQHLRRARADAGLARRGRRLEPDLGHGRRDPGPVRQRGRRHQRELAGRERVDAGHRLARADRRGVPAAGGVPLPQGLPLTPVLRTGRWRSCRPG